MMISVLLVSVGMVMAVQPADKGFDQYGYNLQARNFVGTGESWSLAKGLPANYLGIYAQDKLVMKWNKAWDDCNDAGNTDQSVCTGAFLNNEWNGMIPGGSGETEHVKIVWVGDCIADQSLVPEGGYCIWDNYVAIQDFYGPGQPEIWAHAISNGYGAYK